MRLIFGQDAAVAEWVSRRIPYITSFKDFVAIGVADGNRPIAGVVYDTWQPEYRTMQVSVAAIDPRWAQRGVLRALLHYPFEQMGVYKLWSAMAAENERALKFNRGIGFKRDGILRHQFGPKKHAVFTSMIEPEYRKRYAMREPVLRSA
jgi:RimJ/RimL family protein N-acetyltransferase